MHTAIREVCGNFKWPNRCVTVVPERGGKMVDAKNFKKLCPKFSNLMETVNSQIQEVKL